MSENHYGEDVKRKETSDKLMAHLPTITPGMRTAQDEFVGRRISFQEFGQICHDELQALKYRQELEQEN
jgi:hypothetical protein